MCGNLVPIVCVVIKRLIAVVIATISASRDLSFPHENSRPMVYTGLCNCARGAINYEYNCQLRLSNTTRPASQLLSATNSLLLGFQLPAVILVAHF